MSQTLSLSFARRAAFQGASDRRKQCALLRVNFLDLDWLRGSSKRRTLMVTTARASSGTQIVLASNASIKAVNARPSEI